MAEGRTQRLTPRRIRPPCSRWKKSIVAAFGHQPSPLMVSTVPLSARYIMSGATPPMLVRSACVTLMQSPAATPASTAFPPASRMRYAAAAAK